MLKPLLLSGWFRIQPFLKYVVVVMLIAPLVGASGHSSSAKQSEAAKIAAIAVELNSEPVDTPASENLPENSQQPEVIATPEVEFNSEVPAQIAALTGRDLSDLFQADQNNPQIDEDTTVSAVSPTQEPLPTLPFVEPKAPSVPKAPKAQTEPTSTPDGLTSTQKNLVEKIRIAKQNSPRGSETSSVERKQQSAPTKVAAAPISPPKGGSVQPSKNAPASTEPSQGQQHSTDPIGSPHPIPWNWIMSTHEAMSSKGITGVRHYRSAPVISPDGRYAMYSRVQLEVQPELYNSRVSSVLFIEDRQTKRLRVVSATSANKDALLKVKKQLANDPNGVGTIGVLVPVSWSQEGDRFLARKFEGVFNTSDSSDRAVIWDRQKDNTNTVAPSKQKPVNEEHDHEQISVLLGWSKSQPDHVMFRTGQIGDEEWPTVNVSSEGKTVTTSDSDQPTTYGEKVSDVWGRPSLAIR